MTDTLEAIKSRLNNHTSSINHLRALDRKRAQQIKNLNVLASQEHAEEFIETTTERLGELSHLVQSYVTKLNVFTTLNHFMPERMLELNYWLGKLMDDEDQQHIFIESKPLRQWIRIVEEYRTACEERDLQLNNTVNFDNEYALTA